MLTVFLIAVKLPGRKNGLFGSWFQGVNPSWKGRHGGTKHLLACHPGSRERKWSLGPRFMLYNPSTGLCHTVNIWKSFTDLPTACLCLLGDSKYSWADSENYLAQGRTLRAGWLKQMSIRFPTSHGNLLVSQEHVPL